MYQDLLDLFSEYDTDVLCVSDFVITYRGTTVDYIALDEEGKIHVYAGGNPINDDNDYWEELLPTRSELDAIIDEIVELF